MPYQGVYTSSGSLKLKERHRPVSSLIEMQEDAGATLKFNGTSFHDKELLEVHRHSDIQREQEAQRGQDMVHGDTDGAHLAGEAHEQKVTSFEIEEEGVANVNVEVLQSFKSCFAPPPLCCKSQMSSIPDLPPSNSRAWIMSLIKVDQGSRIHGSHQRGRSMNTLDVGETSDRWSTVKLEVSGTTAQGRSQQGRHSSRLEPKFVGISTKQEVDEIRARPRQISIRPEIDQVRTQIGETLWNSEYASGCEMSPVGHGNDHQLQGSSSLIAETLTATSGGSGVI
ncbi:hypothetical protein B0O80DRAFT_526046 [Mortierella sp. GBAus27b]|nr:hypothetical protein B0O80DRAFT_526046 [Mortierella sp. GBAus27b]